MWIYSLFILFNSSDETINSVKAKELHAKQILPRAYQSKSHGPVNYYFVHGKGAEPEPWLGHRGWPEFENRTEFR